MAQTYQVDIVTKVTNISSVARLEKALKNLASDQDKVDKAARRAAGGQKKFGDAAAKSGRSAKTASGGVKTLMGALTRLAATYITAQAAVTLFNNSIAAAGARGQAEKQLQNLTSSTHEYETALLAAKVASQRFGITQTDATQALATTLSRLKGLGFTLAEVNDVYTGFNVIATKAAVSGEVAAGAFLQLSQALGSGTLQGDELRSILERMPELGVAIKDALGPAGATGSIKELASQGKLTSEVILKALQGAASGADDLNGRLTKQQMTMDAARVAADQFFVAMGRAFAPAFLAVVEQLTFAVSFMGSLLTQAATAMQDNADAVQAFAVTALRLGAVVGVIVAVVKAVNLVRNAITLTTTAMKTLLAFAGPKGWAVLAAGAGAAAIATYGAVEANKALDKAMEDMMAQAKADGEENVKRLQEQLKLYQNTNREGQTAKVTKEQEAAATKALAAAQREYQAALGSEQGDVDRKLQVTQAILNAEKQINDAKLQQANADLQSATTLAEKESAIQRIYDVTVANAKLEYQATIAAAKAEQLKVEAALRHAEVLAKQIRAEVALQKSKGITNQAQKDALRNASELVATAQKNLEAQNQINEAVRTGAAATLDKQLQAAKVTMEMQKQSAQQEQTNAAISRGADEMGRLAANASRASSAAASVSAAAGGGGGGGGGGISFTNNASQVDMYKLDEQGNIVKRSKEERALDAKRHLLRYQNQLAWNAEVFDIATRGSDYSAIAHSVSQRGGSIGPVGSQLYETYRTGPGSRTSGLNTIHGMVNDPNNVFNVLQTRGYAEGGYVTSPEQAVVGEGGEPEYIIPASKMSQAMSRYSSGMRGEGVIPKSATVNVSYNGSTVNMGGSDYIKRDDVPGLLNSAVNQTLGTLRRSPRSRLYAGFDR